jgi:2,4-dienoyl-CoA reductase (NADPH2)
MATWKPAKRFDILFSPVRIGTLELRNRLVMSPMTTDYATDEQLPSPRLLAYLEERARGGVGLVTLEACTIDRRQREVVHSMHFSDDSVIEPHRELVRRIHAHGAAVWPQLVHPGPDSMSPLLDRIPSVGPSVIPSYLTGQPCRELAREELPEIVELYAAAARRVREAGYDGLELHAAHGYMLLGSFLSPVRNRRDDEYTGRTQEGRIRLVVEVLRAIKAAAGAEFPVALRISGYERAPGGRPLADTQRIAPRLAAAGVDAFHVSGGSVDRYVSQIVTGSQWPDAHNAPAAAAVRRVVDVPVMVAGRIHDPRLAEALLRRGDADLVAMGRPLLADPELPRKARAGRVREIRRCISCQHCIDSMERMQMSCAVNGRSGREAERSLAPAPRARRVVVVGGGPAGLEAARVARLRGHRVTLLERERVLGGALRLAAAVHPENAPLLDFLTGEVRRLGIDLRLGVAATAAGVGEIAPEVAVVATGGRLALPELPGSDLPHVWTGALLRGLLSGAPPDAAGRRLPAWLRLGARALGAAQPLLTPARIRWLARLALPLGRRVAVVGADLAGVELAELLAQLGRRVVLLESGERIAPEVGGKRRSEHMDRLDRLGVSVHAGLVYHAIDPEGVRVAAAEGPVRLVPADSVVLTGRLEPDTVLYEALRGVVPEVFAIGDCTGLGLIRKATDDASRVACAI